MENRSNELYHYGRKGMKWGQHIFGKQKSVSSARRSSGGSNSLSSKVSTWKKKRVTKKEVERKEKLAAKQVEAIKKKSVADMTDEELNRAINRARMEDMYRSLRPEQVSAGKKFLETTVNKVIVPAATEAGKNFLKNALDKFGDDMLKDAVDPDSIAALTTQRDKLRLKKEIADYKNPSAKEPSWDDKKKQAEYETYMKDEKVRNLKRENEYNAAKEKHDKWKAKNEPKYETSSEGEGTTTLKDNEYEIKIGKEWFNGADLDTPPNVMPMGQNYVPLLLEDKSR